MKVLGRSYTGKYAPNHIEFDYWVDLTSDPHGSVVKTYNSSKRKWVILADDDDTSDDGDAGESTGGISEGFEWNDV